MNSNYRLTNKTGSPYTVYEEFAVEDIHGFKQMNAMAQYKANMLGMTLTIEHLYDTGTSWDVEPQRISETVKSAMAATLRELAPKYHIMPYVGLTPDDLELEYAIIIDRLEDLSATAVAYLREYSKKLTDGIIKPAIYGRFYVFKDSLDGALVSTLEIMID